MTVFSTCVQVSGLLCLSEARSKVFFPLFGQRWKRCFLKGRRMQLKPVAVQTGALDGGFAGTWPCSGTENRAL